MVNPQIPYIYFIFTLYLRYISLYLKIFIIFVRRPIYVNQICINLKFILEYANDRNPYIIYVQMILHKLNQ